MLRVLALGGSWLVISRVIGRITLLITYIRALITPLITTYEPPSRATLLVFSSLVSYFPQVLARVFDLGAVFASGDVTLRWCSSGFFCGLRLFGFRAGKACARLGVSVLASICFLWR